MLSERLQRQVDQLLDRAEQSAAADDWNQVREICARVLAIDPENADARGFAQMAAATPAAAAAGRPDTSGADIGAFVAEIEAPALQLPDSYVEGRYQVRGFLGEGGRKQVYLAHDTRLDRDVAFALIKTEGLDANGRQRIQREAQAMGRLSGHPHIVTIHDVGEEDGQPYIVSEYMAGGDVEALLAAAENHQLDLERSIAIADQVAQALEHAHADGIVHRDLKPGNIWLAEDGTAKLGDFGLAFASSETRMTTEGTMLGTVAYMPPEQALGDTATPQSDLYSLGCALYEMVTGQPPFLGEDVVSVISQHLNTAPVAPSWHREECPSALETVIESLLAKEEDDRPRSASAVSDALAAIDPAEPAAAVSQQNPLDRLARGVFVGRDQELRQVRRAFDDALAGHGGLVMLVGEPGIGKTRTALELQTYARVRGAVVHWGRIHETAGAPAYWPWIQIGRSLVTALGVGSEESAWSLVSSGASELSRLFPELREMQPDLPALVEGPDPMAAQFRLFDAYTTFIANVAREAPLVLVLDDLQWADRPTLQLLQHLARELAGMRVLLLGTFRDTDLGRTHPLSEALAAVNRESGFDRVVLRGLSQDEVRTYIRTTSNIEPSPPVLDRIFEETEGNPFFLSEIVNLMAEEGTLAATSLSEIAIPDGVKEALGRRLDRLSEDANALLQIAAVVGREFPYDTLAALEEHDDDALLRLLDEAIEARVIEEMDRPGRYRFTHHLMQETLIEELSATRRIRLHGRIGEALEQRFGDGAAARASRLAEHFYPASTLGGAYAEKAVRYGLLAAEQGERDAAWDEARAQWQRALGVIEDTAMQGYSVAELLEQAERWADSGAMSHREAAEYLRRALEIYEAARDAAGMARAHISLGRMCSTSYRPEMMDLPLAREHFAAAERLLEGQPVSPDTVRLHNYATTAAWNGLWVEEGLRWAEEARAAARALGDETMAAWAEAFAGSIEINAGDVTRGWERVLAAHTISERRNDAVLGGIVAVVGIPQMLELLLEPIAAHDLAERELALERQSRVRGFDISCQMAVAAREMGEVAAGADLLAEFAAAGDLSSAVTNAHTQLSLAALRYRNGDWETAAETLTHQNQLALRGSGTLDATLMTLRLASLKAAWGASQEAATLLEAMLALLPSSALLPRFAIGAELAVIQARSGAIDAAAAQVQLCQEIEAQGDRWGGRAGRLRLAEALIALARGGYVEAVQRRDEAIRLLESNRARWEAADATFIWARALRQAGRAAEAEAEVDACMENYRALDASGRWLDRILELRLQLRGGVSADPQSSIELVAASMESHPPDLRAQAAPDGTVTLLFSDIENSTARTAELGDGRWMDLLREHNSIVRQQLSAHAGYEVKSMGDGFMLAFRSASDGLRCAIAMQLAFDERNASSEEILRVRMGLHTGDAIREADDFFGAHVNLAARIGGAAQGEEILVSGLLKALTETAGEFTFAGGREIELKGISEPQRVHSVEWR